MDLVWRLQKNHGYVGLVCHRHKIAKMLNGKKVSKSFTTNTNKQITSTRSTGRKKP